MSMINNKILTAVMCAATVLLAGQVHAGGKMVTTKSGLRYEIKKEGTGPVATKGKVVRVHYTGWLNNGADGEGDMFDSSVKRGKPFEFALGGGQVIRGWDEGVEGMKVGEVRRLYIPASLGYGAYGAGGIIKPHANLIFDVELLGIVR